MTISYQLSDPLSWEFLWSGSQSVAIVPKNLQKVTPIPEIFTNIQPISSIVAIRAHSASNPGHWKFGGYASQKVQAALNIDGNVSLATINTQKIWLDRTSILFFPQITDSYYLTFNIPYWVRQIDLTVWQYIGEIEDNIEQKLEYIQGILQSLFN